ncbi:MAG: acyl carrier protein [Candidatus Binatia bacterium]
MAVKDDVVEVLRSLLERHKRPLGEVSLETPLYAEGIGLDSLQAAELSAMLEDRLGHDPYSSGEVPQTVGDIVAYYER